MSAEAKYNSGLSAVWLNPCFCGFFVFLCPLALRISGGNKSARFPSDFTSENFQLKRRKKQHVNFSLCKTLRFIFSLNDLTCSCFLTCTLKLRPCACVCARAHGPGPAARSLCALQNDWWAAGCRLFLLALCRSGRTLNETLSTKNARRFFLLFCGWKNWRKTEETNDSNQTERHQTDQNQIRTGHTWSQNRKNSQIFTSRNVWHSWWWSWWWSYFRLIKNVFNYFDLSFLESTVEFCFLSVSVSVVVRMPQHKENKITEGRFWSADLFLIFGQKRWHLNNY